jgi:thiosulfate/3-mercaptopyruvate sulfurtransferase
MTSPLITAHELTESLGDHALFDVRWSLSDPTHGARSYNEGHIPGAVFVDLDRDLAAPPGEGRHPLPSPPEFTRTLRRLGLSHADDVVVYDDAGGAVSARMWWMLRSIGHGGDVRVLDGGIQAWSDASMPLEQNPVVPVPTDYPPVSGFHGVVGHDDLEGRVVADVRAPERYLGEIEPIDPKAGHIPGAVNYPFTDNLEEGRFRSPMDLARRYRDFPDGGVVSCGSGVNACHAALALVVAGRPLPDVYVGSFSDWSRRDLPVATGPEP